MYDVIEIAPAPVYKYEDTCKSCNGKGTVSAHFTVAEMIGFGQVASAGQKIAMLKRVREIVPGFGLKAAKDFIEVVCMKEYEASLEFANSLIRANRIDY